MSKIRRYCSFFLGICIAILPFFLNNYWIDVVSSVGLYVILALSLNVILGQTGIFHMGHSAFYAIGAYVTAILNTYYQVPTLWLLPLAGFITALFALIIVRPIISLQGDYLLIVTIGIVEIVRIALINDIGGVTGGSNGIFGISRPIIGDIIIRTTTQFYYLIWSIVALTILLFSWLFSSRYGRAFNSIKEDEVAAEGSGINVIYYKWLAFIVGAFWAGVAGNLFASKMTVISPASFTIWESIIIFVIVILSGGSQLGVILGTFFVIALPEIFRSLADARMLIFGLLMMIMMVVRPQGLLPPLPRVYNIRNLLYKKHFDFGSPISPRKNRDTT